MNATQSVAAALIITAAALFFTACSSAPPCPDDAAPEAPAEEATAEATATAEVEPPEPIDPIVDTFDEASHRVAPDGSTSVVWLAEGNNAYVGQITLQPEAEVPAHRHDAEEYLFIKEGGGLLTIEDEEFELGPGTIVAIPQNAEHSYINGPEETTAFQVFSSPEGAARFLEWPEKEEEKAKEADVDEE